MDKQDWQVKSKLLKDLFGLGYSPVALACFDNSELQENKTKVRICQAILDAGAGKILQVNKSNNICPGASWHLGFHKIRNEKVGMMLKNFVVEGEKLFCSHQALDNLVSQMPEPLDNSQKTFLLSPLEKMPVEPELVIFIVNPEEACRLLAFMTFVDGDMPKIKIGGPTCRLAITYPLVTGQVNISFYDYTARRLCNMDKNKLIVSIPYTKIPQIIANIDKCSAGAARVELPQR